MDTSSTESSERLRRAIDDEIISLQESILALKSRRNALAPISRLPPETLAAIFSLLSSYTWCTKAGNRGSICVTYVCRRWRETALNHPHLWTCIDFNKLTPAAMAEILARSKAAPLCLEAYVTKLSVAQHNAFERHLEDHISHTRRLDIWGHLRSAIKRLVSFAPLLESVSLSHESDFFESSAKVAIPVNLFNCTAPVLTSLRLHSCDISWKSPILKRLRTLKVYEPSTEARPKLEDWLDALNEMPQLETLVLRSAIPLAPPAALLISETPPSVTLPSLTEFHISASAKDCTLALAHLVLPALSRLHVEAESHEREGGDVQLLIPYVARNTYRLQGTEPLRGISISGERTRAKVFAWEPDTDNGSVPYSLSRNSGLSDPARLVFTATCRNWDYGVDTGIFVALLTLLPVDSVSTLTTENRTRLSKEFWLSHASRWPLLERARLVPASIKAFSDMLAENAPPDGPRLPLLTELTLVEVRLTALKTFRLRDMLIERVEQGVPLEVLDLSTCAAGARSIDLVREIVVDVLEPQPARRNSLMESEGFKWYGGIGYRIEVEYDDPYDDEEDEDDEDDEDEDEDEDDNDEDDEDEDEDIDEDEVEYGGVHGLRFQ